jgi:hypothetical protein
MEAEALQQFFGGGVGRRPSSPTPVCRTGTDTYCRTELWIDFFLLARRNWSHHSTSRHLKARRIVTRIVTVTVLRQVGIVRVHFAYLNRQVLKIPNLILTSHVATVEKSMHT